MHANNKGKIAIVGGSLAGLMTGIELAHAGIDVDIYERSERVLDDRGAGIVMQPETEYILTRRCGLPREQIGVQLAYRQYLNKDGTRQSHQYLPQTMTSWGLIYAALRSTFPKDKYRTGTPLEAFAQETGRVVMQFKRTPEVAADCLVGADGARSLVRKTLFPDLEPAYAGYVAWRGVVPEAKASEQLMSVFADHFTFQQMRHSHILCYLIPGPNGETGEGQRRLNWVWYWNVPQPELPFHMTGRCGRIYDFSVPPGQLRDEVIQKQNEIAERLFAPPFLELWRATEGPFLQPILDLGVARMVNGRVALVGDAAFIPRPHTAASTSKAAANAIALGKTLARPGTPLPDALNEWQQEQLDLGQHLLHHGKALGDRSQFN